MRNALLRVVFTLPTLVSVITAAIPAVQSANEGVQKNGFDLSQDHSSPTRVVFEFATITTAFFAAHAGLTFANLALNFPRRYLKRANGVFVYVSGFRHFTRRPNHRA
jgi:hypothetical protein